ncbi:family 2A encapsulin nanocompartment cargo protein cysteine desulfurase [Acinetobacter chinensis]|uniref:cysteine desulfurase n=1 Tax=Acinetobacter chinensis TaxID=2004650 RepID=A0ABU3WEI1_9GAMM|nr:family 2A encapsulin nanocompartment cargo protein cysteine desulfurase [Acinetobacter chinensis]MDV2468814.1 family 2A encapsulin nanocompartment cargo protein cysteine desulfurase [Acinetobacter chinensis]
MTIQALTSNSLPTDTSSAQADAPISESVLTQLAAEFFSALPKQNAQGLNLDLPEQATGNDISHPPQPKDPIAALSGRVPAVVQQNSLNPSATQRFADPTADHPERRVLSSAPVIGGAHNPDPSALSNRIHLPSATTETPSASTISQQNTAQGQSAYYFLDIPKPDALQATAPSDVLRNPFAFDDYHVVDDHQLKGLLKDRNDKPAITESGYYFASAPSVEQSQFQREQNLQIPTTAQNHQPIDILQIRRDFPILQERVNGKPLIWLDNAATTHKPKAVIDRISYFYEHENSNIHRAAHELAARASDAYEHARDVVARFIGAPSAQNIVFVRGTTEGINLIAKSWGKQNIGAGDEIIVSNLEHHANIVPWFQLTKETGAKLRVIPVDDTGQIRIDEFIKLLNPKTKLVAITQVSNALGTVTPTQEIIALAHAAGVRVLIDGAQSVSHMPTNVTALDADFFVFSGHKVFGPTGIGAVYAKAELLDSMPVWEGGGNMIQDVTFENVIYQPAPNKFEAGTGNIADAVGLGAALEYVESIGIHNIARYEHDLLEYGQHALQSVSGLRLIGTALNKASVMSFTLAGYETEEVGKVLNQYGIAVRTGHHCAQPILRRFGVERTVRPSLAFYNTTEEIDLLVSVLHQLRRNRSLRT